MEVVSASAILTGLTTKHHNQKQLGKEMVNFCLHFQVRVHHLGKPRAGGARAGTCRQELMQMP